MPTFFMCSRFQHENGYSFSRALDEKLFFYRLIELHDERAWSSPKKIMPKWGPKWTSSYIYPHETRTCCAKRQFFDYVRVCFLTAQTLSWKNGQRTGLARNFARHRPFQHKTRDVHGSRSMAFPFGLDWSMLQHIDRKRTPSSCLFYFRTLLANCL